VTAEDFEVLACAASPAVARANCLAVRDGADSSTPPGRVRVQLVPAITAGVGPVPEPQLFVSTQVERVVKQYLDDRRLICCELAVERPIYIHVSVVARLHIRPEFNATRVADEALEGLYRYVHPTTGGPDGHGWPFERPLFVSEVYSLLQRIPGVDMVEHAGLYQVDPRTGDRGDELSRVTPGSDGLLCSHEHRISLV
jgi:predicted phage baseplate assembly protein